MINCCYNTEQGCICRGWGFDPLGEMVDPLQNSKGVDFNSPDDPSCLFEIVSMQHCVIVNQYKHHIIWL